MASNFQIKADMDNFFEVLAVLIEKPHIHFKISYRDQGDICWATEMHDGS